MFKLAIVATPPVVPDRRRLVPEAVDCLEAAAGGDAGLVAFPEAFAPGCPVWIRRMLDIVGRSARPDGCEPQVNRQPQSAVAFE